MQVQAKLTSKGQITIPREIHALMGVNPGIAPGRKGIKRWIRDLRSR